MIKNFAGYTVLNLVSLLLCLVEGLGNKMSTDV
jgi:hypothetical protein